MPYGFKKVPGSDFETNLSPSSMKIQKKVRRTSKIVLPFMILLPIAGLAHHSAASDKIDKFSFILPILFKAISSKQTDLVAFV